MQNTEIQAFAVATGRLIPDAAKRRIVVPYLLGMALGSFLQVKLGTDLAASTNYSSSHAANVARAVSFFNEHMILDIAPALEAAKSMYLVRDRIVNGTPCDFNANPEFNVVAVMLGFASIMPLEVYATMNETGLGANKIYSMALLLVDKLKAANAISL